MIIKLIKTEEDFFQLKNKWNSLMEGNKNLTNFQSWEFNYNWWQTYKSDKYKLYILLVEDKKNIIFLLPTYINENGCLKFIQSGSVDFLDAIYREDEQKLHIIFSKLKKFIMEDTNIKCIILNNIRKVSIILDYLPTYFQKKKFFILQSDLFSYINKNFYDKERYLKYLKSKQVSELRRIDKTINSIPVVIEKNYYEFPEKILNNILDKMVKNKKRDEKMYKKFFEVMRKLYEEDKIFFISQKIGEEYVSISCIVRLDSNNIMIWIDLFDPNISKINIKNYLHILRFCQKNSLNLNFGTGIYSYKLKNFLPSVSSLYTFYFYKNKLNFLYFFLRKTVAKISGVI